MNNNPSSAHAQLLALQSCRAAAKKQARQEPKHIIQLGSCGGPQGETHAGPLLNPNPHKRTTVNAGAAWTPTGGGCNLHVGPAWRARTQPLLACDPRTHAPVNAVAVHSPAAAAVCRRSPVAAHLARQVPLLLLCVRAGSRPPAAAHAPAAAAGAQRACGLRCCSLSQAGAAAAAGVHRACCRRHACDQDLASLSCWVPRHLLLQLLVGARQRGPQDPAAQYTTAHHSTAHRSTAEEEEL